MVIPSLLNPDSNDKPITDEGSLVIRIGSGGSFSSEIIANQSEAQEHLLNLMNCLRPALNDALENRR